jgi:hypothetical protein
MPTLDTTEVAGKKILTFYKELKWTKTHFQSRHYKCEIVIKSIILYIKYPLKSHRFHDSWI